MKIRRRASQATVPSMAMGDIAFNLLIFFVILARADDDSHLKWVAASSPEVEKAGFSSVKVLVDTENRLYLNGKQIGIAQLATSVESLLGDRPQGKRTVLLKIHNETQAVRFEPIIEAISQAGGDLVHILDKKK